MYVWVWMYTCVFVCVCVCVFVAHQLYTNTITKHTAKTPIWMRLNQNLFSKLKKFHSLYFTDVYLIVAVIEIHFRVHAVLQMIPNTCTHKHATTFIQPQAERCCVYSGEKMDFYIYILDKIFDTTRQDSYTDKSSTKVYVQNTHIQNKTFAFILGSHVVNNRISPSCQLHRSPQVNQTPS